MAFRLGHLPESVAGVLCTYYRVRRLYGFLRILCVAFLLYLSLAVVAMHLDRLLFLTPAARLAIFWVVHALAGTVAVVAMGWFLLRPPSVTRIAYELEDRLPDGESERYVTLESLLREPGTGDNAVRTELLDQLRRSTEAASADVRPGALVRDPFLRKLVVATLIALIVVGGLCAIPAYRFPLMVRRFLQPEANLPKPSFVRIRVTPESLVLGRGGEAVIQAEIQGEIPAFLSWLYRLAGAAPNRCVIEVAPGRSRDVHVDLATARDLSRIERRLFVFSQSELEESFSYRLRCGDAETEVRFVDVVAQPRITELRVVATPPAYTRRPVENIVDPRQPIRLFPGTKVELSFTVDQPAPERTLLLGARKGLDLKWDEETRTGRYAFTMRDKVDIEIRVANARGFANVDRARVSLVRLDDQAPVVQLEYPTSDLAVVPGELIPVLALAEDDLEVAEATIQFQLNPETNPDAPFQELPVTVPELSGTRVSLTENFDLGRTSAGPGDEILFVVRVRDSGGNDGESRPVRIRVTAFTRGENERRRLGAARIVADLLDRIGDKLPAPAAPALDRHLYEQAFTQCAALGIALEE
ncbi:MAG: hypothetical protein HQ559_06820, partial [Lentisphaerae bacterium]|nr:hypothetical protein [Lentisphaerota bacterium]